MENRFPIVDTDIWVYLVLTKYDQRVLKRFGGLLFSDAVEEEIIKWKTNKGDSKNIWVLYEKYKTEGKFITISFEDFSTEEQQIINHQLVEYGLQKAGVSEQNKGEFVSLLYAINLKINRFKTNDRKFESQLSESLKKNITIVNWDSILRNYSNTIKEETATRELLASREKKMKEANTVKTDPRWEKLRALTI